MSSASSPRHLPLLAAALTVALALLALSGCGGSSSSKPAAAAPTTSTTAAPTAPDLGAASTGPHATFHSATVALTYDGMARSDLLATPTVEGAGRTLPVIVVLHGRAATPAIEEQRTGLPGVVGPAILVYPAGIGESWNAGNCCGLAQTDDVDDVGFITTVLARVKASQPHAELGPAYLVGYSNGGKMALELACDDSTDFRAEAVYGATDASTCPNRRPANLLMMGGTADPTTPASAAPVTPEADGFEPPSFATEVADYRTADGCDDQSMATSLGRVTLTSWTTCRSGQRVGQAIFAGDTHSWPQGGGTTPSGGAVAWAWFTSLGA